MATARQDLVVAPDFTVTQDHETASMNIQSLDTSSKNDPQPDENQGLENWRVREHVDVPCTMMPRSVSHHLSSIKVPSRKWLKIQARILRALMVFAVQIPKVKAPKKTLPTFTRQLHSGLKHTSPMKLYFYTPVNYYKLLKEGHRFPIVVDFHGGGFCLGQATDDHHWARVVLKNVSCVVVAVNYRLAPEYPIPAAIEDAVNALLYLSANSQELGLDSTKIALSGFSAGANLTFSVPLRLKYLTKRYEESKLQASSIDSVSQWPLNLCSLQQGLHKFSTQQTTKSSSTNLSPINKFKSSHLDLFDTSPEFHAEFANESDTERNLSPISSISLLNLKILTIVAWYPLLDWTTSRAAKKRTSLSPPKTLPKLFTDLFDYSYLPPPDIHGYHCSPYASPGLAPDHMLRDGLPTDIQIWLCEWDMLLAEGKTFSKRLQKLGKTVEETLIEAVPHGFDQSPNPFRDQAKIDNLYTRACVGLNQAFAD